jgi:DnaJ family protein C protein 19
MYQLLVILFILLAIIGIRHISKQPEDVRPKLRLRYGLYALLGLAILLVFSGKLHWVAGAIAAVLPIIQRFFPLFLRALPFFKNKAADATKKKTSTSSNEMDVEQALQVFGFDVLPTEDKVVQRHRELIQKNHPDRGGSDYLAAQINQAKEVLVDATRTA